MVSPLAKQTRSICENTSAFSARVSPSRRKNGTGFSVFSSILLQPLFRRPKRSYTARRGFLSAKPAATHSGTSHTAGSFFTRCYPSDTTVGSPAPYSRGTSVFVPYGTEFIIHYFPPFDKRKNAVGPHDALRCGNRNGASPAGGLVFPPAVRYNKSLIGQNRHACPAEKRKRV